MKWLRAQTWPDNPPWTGHRCGFSLLEALLSLVVLGLLAGVVGTVYATGFQLLEVQSEQSTVDSHLRSKMEYLLTLNFEHLQSGSEDVQVNGELLPLSWTVTLADLSGDGVPEPTAKQITLTLRGQTLITLVADIQGKVGFL